MTSTAIYTCYRQLHPPTGVDHAVFGSVTSPGSRDLVVAKASILELYKVHRQQDSHSNGNSEDNSSDATTSQLKGSGSTADKDEGDDKEGDESSTFFLELAGSFPLAGNVTALSVVPIASASIPASTNNDALQGSTNGKSGADNGVPDSENQLPPQDILVVCFGTSQMALVAYDAGLGRLATLSIHNFDADAIGPGSGGVEPGYSLASALKDRPPTISAFDPAGRCLAAVLGGSQLVVVPTLRHVPRSVFLSEDARERALENQRRKWRRQGDTAAAEREGSGRADGPVRSSSGTLDGRESPTLAVDDISYGASGRPGDGKAVGDKENGGSGLANGGSRVPGAHWTVSRPFTVDLEAAGVEGFIKAAAFLEGFHEPALALLYEPVQTCAGRLAQRRSTCRLVLLSLNLVQ
ncbi:unnamed protein product, partial [Sphacelaria rigidula]